MLNRVSIMYVGLHCEVYLRRYPPISAVRKMVSPSYGRSNFLWSNLRVSEATILLYAFICRPFLNRRLRSPPGCRLLTAVSVTSVIKVDPVGIAYHLFACIGNVINVCYIRCGSMSPPFWWCRDRGGGGRGGGGRGEKWKVTKFSYPPHPSPLPRPSLLVCYSLSDRYRDGSDSILYVIHSFVWKGKEKRFVFFNGNGKFFDG